MATLILLTTEGCHLCDDAKHIVWSAIDTNVVTLEEQDIADDPTLLAKYQWLIPVVTNPQTQRECRWPFGADDVQQLVSEAQ